MFEKNVENLRRAREYLSDPKNWTCGELWERSSRPAEGKMPRACALGALYAAMGVRPDSHCKLAFPVERAMLDHAAQTMYGTTIVGLNDHGSTGLTAREQRHQAVLEAYDAAICALERCETKEDVAALCGTALPLIDFTGDIVAAAGEPYHRFS